jgi:hypothetical protein
MKMPFNEESQKQLEEAGFGLYSMIVGLGDGVDFNDAAAGFQLTMKSQAVMDEIKADLPRALSAIFAAAMAAYSKS